jgi:hypothetical protein
MSFHQFSILDYRPAEWRFSSEEDTAMELGVLAKWLTLCTALAFLPGCGGGGSDAPLGNGNPVVVTPPPTSSPPPVPAPPPGAPVFGSLGQTTSQQFASFGFAYRGADAGFGYTPDPASFEPVSELGIRLVAPSQLLLAIPGSGEGVLTPNGASGTSTDGRLVYLGYSTLGGSASLSAPDLGGDKPYLTSTMNGSWVSAPTSGQPFTYRLIEFVYGVATKAEDVPRSGTANYGIRDLGEDRTLTVDFTACTVSGSISLEGRSYSLRNVVFTADSTGFSGRLTTVDPSLDGFIEGRFTGALASEMMGRLQVPPTQAQSIFLFTGGRS